MKKNHPSAPMRHWLRPASTIGGLLIALWINHRSYLADFNLVPGDAGDTRLLVYTLEHWYQVFLGQEAFFSLHMFHPDPHALAYADAWLLFGLPYAAARAAGLDYFTSYQLLVPLLTVVGYCSWLVLLRRLLRLDHGFAVLGSILLCSLNSLQFMADYGKFAAINLFSLLILLLVGFLRSGPRSSWRGTASLCVFAALLGLLLFTSYMPPWFFMLSLGLFALVSLAAASLSVGARATLATIWRFMLSRRWDVLAGLVVLGLSLLPFIIAYGPLALAGSVRGFDLILEFSPRPQDLINVSSLNYVWSPVLASLGFGFGNREVQLGSPLLILALAAATSIILLRQVTQTGWLKTEATTRHLLLLAATAVLLLLLSVNVGGFSAWYLIYKLVPGATAVRALGRILVMVDMIAIVLGVYGLQLLYRRLRLAHGSPAILAACLLALAVALVAEQVNAMTFRLDKRSQLAFMDRYGAPQQECTAFFINNAQSDTLPFGYYHLDAMMVSMRLGIPTVNGYSGMEPHEAFTLVPRGNEYRYRINEWLRQEKATEGICELDYFSGAFRMVDVDLEFVAAQQAYRTEILDTFSALYAAAGQFIRDGNDPTNLFPEFLETHGYLDAALGYETGVRYRWIGERYWIGERACGKRRCVGIGVTGRYDDLSPIVERYGPSATAVLFPDPQVLQSSTPPAADVHGDLLLIFETRALIP